MPTSLNPALTSFATYWCSARAPATQPIHSSMFFLMTSGTCSPDHDVGHGEAAAGLQHAERLPQHLVLVARQVDHAVRDDHVHRVVGQRDVLDLALEELDVRRDRSCACSLRARASISSVMSRPYALPVGADPPGRQQHVDAAAGAQVEHRLARPSARPAPSDCRSRATPSAPGPAPPLPAVVVQVRGDRIAARLASPRRCRSTRSGRPTLALNAAWPYFSRTISLTCPASVVIAAPGEIYIRVCICRLPGRDIFVKAYINDKPNSSRWNACSRRWETRRACGSSACC